MLKNRFNLLVVMLIAGALLAGVILTACADYQGENPTKNTGDSYTEDVGLFCDYPCLDEWCFTFNYPECLAKLCVGQAEDQYCSNFCLNQWDCPSGYVCTDLCDKAVQYKEEPYCVLEKDYKYLQDLGLCQ